MTLGTHSTQVECWWVICVSAATGRLQQNEAKDCASSGVYGAQLCHDAVTMGI